MTDTPAEQPEPEQSEPDQPKPDDEKGTPGLLGDALSPVVAPENTDEERLSEPEGNDPPEEGSR
jgi:hypothetical protein